jgi:Zn-dependent protease with chaperone function
MEDGGGGELGITLDRSQGFGDHASLPPEISLAIEEYRTVRQEELVALQSQISTLRYGVTGCVVLIGVAAQQHTDRYLGWAISLALVPLVVLFSAVIWMGEYERMARTGQYIAELERRINERLADSIWRPLRWEGWLRENAHSRVVGGHHRYLAIASVFIGFQIAAVAMGLHFYWHQHAQDPSRKWLIPMSVAINIAILLTLLGYFRSSYERLRDYMAEPGERNPPVRQRVRMRVRLYAIVGTVAFISAPFYSWPLGLFIVWGLNKVEWFGHVPVYWAAFPILVWMVIVPFISSRGLMRELLKERILPEKEIDKARLGALEERGLLKQLVQWEAERLRMVQSEEINAPSIGRNRHVIVTSDALAEEEHLPGVLAHEVGHHRLHHLYPLALSYIYLWPYLYYDDRVLRRVEISKASKVSKVTRRALFTLAALPGWLAWVVLRCAWRTAEYDADRYACASGHGNTLAEALRRHKRIHEERQPKRWQDRLDKGQERPPQGRGLGYLPVPNEHPTPARRLERLEEWLWTRPTAGSHPRGGIQDPSRSSP